MTKMFLDIEEAKDRFYSELEGAFDGAACDARIAAYWWNRLTGNKAHFNGDGKAVIEIDPENVEQLLRVMFDEHFDDDDLDQLAHYWGLVGPTTIEVILGDDGEYKGLEETLDDDE